MLSYYNFLLKNLTNVKSILLILLLLMCGFTDTLKAQNTLDRLGLNDNAPKSAAAYSLRKLSSSYTGPLIRIRIRNPYSDQFLYITDPDNPQYVTPEYYDVYPDNNGMLSKYSPVSYPLTVPDAPYGGSIYKLLSQALYQQSVGTLVIWYDQSGNNRNMTQNDLPAQPLMSLNSWINNLDNGRPFIKFLPQSFMKTQPGIFFPDATTIVASASGLGSSSSILLSKCGGGSSNKNKPEPFDYTNTAGDLVTGDGSNYQNINLLNTNPRSDISMTSTGNAFKAFSFLSKRNDTTRAFFNSIQTGKAYTTYYQDYGNPMYIGGRNDGSVNGNMLVSEIVTFNTYFSSFLLLKALNTQLTNFINASYFVTPPSTVAQTGCVGFAATPLIVSLNNPKDVINVRWYRSQSPTPDGLAAELVGDSTLTFTPNTTKPGTFYYFAKVGKTNPIYSAVSGPITVKASQPSGIIDAPKSLCIGTSDTLKAPALPAGGEVSKFGKYRVHTFKQSGTFRVPAGFKGQIEVLIVGGGGGGGGNGGGGGGAGGLFMGLINLNDTSGKISNVNVYIGNGGVAGTNGENSSVGNIIANGGGSGASRGIGLSGGAGGSGGGGAGATLAAEAIGGNSILTNGRQGSIGSSGTSVDWGCNAAGGGGGGYARFEPYEMWTEGSSGASGNGGAGIYLAWDGIIKAYAAGGAGGRTCNNVVLGKGGSNIGGNGGGNPTLATNGTANTGSGGGGGGGIGQGGSGGSGIVIIRYINDTTAKWRSSNPSIISVDSITGIVRPLAVGTAIISLNSSDCSDTPSITSIIVSPQVELKLTSDSSSIKQAKCVGENITNIVYSISSASTATVDNLPPGISYSKNGTILAITGTPSSAASGIYKYTVTVKTGPGCSASATGTITVNVKPSITLISSAGTDAQNACLNKDIGTISYALIGATSAFPSGLPVGITGEGNIGFTLFTIYGKPSALSSATPYTIGISGLCGSTSKSGTIAVLPVATIALTSAAATSNQTKFIGNSIDNISFNTTLATGATVTGLPTGVTGVWANNALTISGTPTQVGNFNYTVNATGGGACSATSTGSMIIKALSTDATLSNLSSNSTNSLNPIFSSANTSYNLNVPNAVSSITLTPTSRDAYASITINGVAVARGVASQAIMLNSGSNAVTIKITAQDGGTNKDYNINIIKAYPIPAITYTNPQTYEKGSAITTLSPTNTGGNVALPASIANVTTFAGNGNSGSTNGSASNASFRNPTGVVVDGAGNVYVADGANGLIRKITPTGTVSWFSASFSSLPFGVIVQNSGNLYVSDFDNHIINNITQAGVRSVFAGSSSGSTNAIGTSARFSKPSGMVLDNNGNIFVADAGNNRIRKITPAAVVTTFAGSGSGYKDATGTNAKFSNPQGIAIDKAGNLYVADGDNNRIRKITTAGVVSTIAGSGVAGNSDGVGTAASFNMPLGIAVDSLGNIYVADAGNNSIRKISTIGVVTTLAGINGISASVDGLNNTARFKQPTGITIDNMGNAYIADQADNKIRKMTIGGGYSISPALPQGLVIDATTGNISGTPSVATAAKNYTITAANETGVSTAIVNITVTAGSNNANLNNLVLNGGTLAPSFISAITAYTSTVDNAITSVTVTPTVAEANATIQVRVNNGSYAPLASASSSVALSLNIGLNPIDVMVTAQDGTTIKTYTIQVTRAASSNAKLSSLVSTAGLLSPTFSATTTAYTTTVNNATTSITVTPTKFDANASIQIRVNGNNYSTTTSGVASSALALNVGINTIDVKVIAEDGTTNKTYTITVNRAPSTNANLSSLTTTAGALSPAFAAATTAYTASVAYSTTNVTVTPTVADASATIQVRVNGGSYATINSGSASPALDLNFGPNTIDVNVVASDGATIKTYTIAVSRVLTPGNALQFDAVNDNVDLGFGLNTYFAGKNQITVETWINIPQLAQNNGFSTPIGNYNSNALMQYMIRLQNGVPTFYISPNTLGASGFKTVSAQSIIPLNKWVHIAATWDGSALRIYYNGVLEGTQTSVTGAFPTLASNSLKLSTTYTNEIFNGKIDEVKIWDMARTQIQIQSDMLSVANSGTSNLKAYYNFDAGTASGINTGINTLLDQSGNSNNGILNNFALTGTTSNWVESYAMVVPTATAATSISSAGFTANWTAPTIASVTNYLLDVSASSAFASAIIGSPFTIATGTTSSAITGLNPSTLYYYRVRADKTSVTGQGGYSTNITTATTAIQPPGNALNFDGINDKVSINNTIGNFGTGNFTIESWVRTTATSGEIIGNRNTGGYGNWFEVGVSAGGNIYFLIDATNASDYTGIQSSAAFNDGRWHHIAAVRSSGQLLIYVDGQQAATPVAINGNPNISNTVVTTLGQYLNGTTPVWLLNGSLDEVRIWNVARSQSLIQSNMFNSMNGAASGLLASYNFDAGIANGTNTGITTLVNQTGNTSNNGTLNNFALTGTTSNWVESYAMVVPSATAATSIGSTGFIANWTAPTLGIVTNYVLDVSTSNTFAIAITGSPFTVAIGTTSKTIAALSPATTYYYRIRAVKTSVSGQGGNSNTISVSTCSPTTSSTSITSCVNYTWNGTTYASSGIYTKTLTNTVGCDSIATLNLTIKQPSASSTTISSCVNYIWNDTTYTASEIYTKTLTNAAGCDSVATLNLTIKQPTFSSTTMSSCVSYTWNGTTYTTSGIYTKTLVNAALCDSIATLFLTIKQPSASSTSISSCGSYTWNDTTYTASGVYTQILANSNGCDSMATLHLTILQPNSSTTIISNCVSYTWNGTNYTSSGVYNEILTNAAGCDSVATLNLTIKQPTTSTTTISNCLSYTWNDTTYTTSGIYNKTFTNADGCDSIATLNLTIKQPTTSTTTVSNCASYTWNGMTYNISGTYTMTLVNAAGCDSIASLNLTIKEASATSTSINNCGNYIWNGTTYTVSGVYTKTFTNAIGCDSVSTLNLTIIQQTSSTTNVSNCVSYFFNGTTYTTSGIYTQNLTNAAGCDSLSILNLTIKQPTVSTTTISSCVSYVWNGVTYTMSGVYTKTLLNAAGCDSVATLNLTIKQPTTSTAVITNCVSYLWNGTTYTTSGVYAKTFTNAAGCDSVAILNLTIKQPTTSTNNISSSVSYVWNGTTFSNSGIYTMNFSNAAGCDSVATLNLTIYQKSVLTLTSTTNTTICSSELPYSWNGLIFNAAGTQTALLTNAQSIDSLATLVLTVTPANTVSVASSVQSLCINTALTNIIHTTTGATGIGTATGLPTGVTAVWANNAIIISGTPTAAGIYSYNIPLTGNCGNGSARGRIIVTALNTVSVASSIPVLCSNTVLTNITNTTTGATGIGVANGLPAGVLAAWANNTITISGTPTTAGIYSYTIPLTGNCGIVNAVGTITVKAVSSSTTNVSICPSELPYNWNGIRTGEGTYTFITNNSVGCDSIATINLTVKRSVQSESFDDISTLNSKGWVTINNSSPLGDSGWFKGNRDFSSISGSGYIASNFESVNNNGNISNWLFAPQTTLQNGGQISFYTRTVSNPSFADRLEVRLSTNGNSTNVGNSSDSVGDFNTLLLTVNPYLLQTGYPDYWKKITITLDSLPASIKGRIAFRYFVIDGGASGYNSDYIGIDDYAYSSYSTSSSITNIGICPSALPFSLNGLTFNAAGSQTALLTNHQGCDSLATLNLTIKQPSTSSTTISNCANYTWNGTTYTVSGVYTKTLTNTVGCDSLATLNLTIKQPTSSTQNVSSCVNYTWNGATYSSTGVYTIPFTNVAGCDSLAILNLTINSPTESITSITNCNNFTWNGTTYIASGVYTKMLTNAAGCDSLAILNLNITTPTMSSTTISNCASYTWNGTIYTTSGIYTKTLVNAAGCDSTATLILNLNICSANILATVFLEGLYTGNGNMIASLFAADGVSSVFIADTIMVELHDIVFPFASVHSSKAMLSTNGSSNIDFPLTAIGNSYYLVIKHRNSIETWSANPVYIDSTGNSYDFSSSISKAFGSNMSDDGNGLFMLFSGDINQDGSIDFNDYPDLDISSNNGDLGYLSYDLNGDASVDFNDYPILDINSNNGIIKLTP